jgi:hypothetical protein
MRKTALLPLVVLSLCLGAAPPARADLGPKQYCDSPQIERCTECGEPLDENESLDGYDACVAAAEKKGLNEDSCTKIDDEGGVTIHYFCPPDVTLTDVDERGCNLGLGSTSDFGLAALLIAGLLGGARARRRGRG